MICPKCGFEQPEAPECARCGIIIDKFRERPAPSELPAPPAADPVPSFTRAYGWPFEVGSVLGDTFRVYFANLVPFLVIAAVALSPMFLALLLISRTMVPEAQSGAPDLSVLVLPMILLFAGGLLGPQVATAAITYGVLQHLRGHDASVGACLRHGLSVLLPVLGVAVLTSLAMGVGFMLCVIPGIIVAVCLAVAVPAAVEERPGVLLALRRSFDLTDGYRFQVFLVLAALTVLGFVVGAALGMLSAGGQAAGLDVPSLVLNLFTTALSATAAAVMYYRLRSAKESIDLEHLTSVFD